MNSYTNIDKKSFVYFPENYNKTPKQAILSLKYNGEIELI